MRGVTWAALLRHIPETQQDGLSVVTKAGTEITINNILRIDHDLFAFKGRLAGTQDAGRLFFMPYDNIDYLGYQRAVKDTEYQETFGNLVLPEPAETASAPIMIEAPPGLPARAPAVLKSAVLERFRSRSAQGNTPRPPSDG